MSVNEPLPRLPDISLIRRASVFSTARCDNTTISNGAFKSHKDYLAEKLRHNWNNKQSLLVELDDSLTNLTWLHGSQTGIKNSTLETDESHQLQQNINHNEEIKTTSSPKDWPFPVDHLTCGHGIFPLPSRNEYRTNPSLKPPFSYATMICMAMRELHKPKIALSDIYNWMSDNFLYYRVCNSSWQNSVRHNLSLNKCFEKVPRRKDEPGKGGFWRVSQKYAHILESGITKRRRPLPYVDSSCSAYINYSFDSAYSPSNRLVESTEDRLPRIVHGSSTFESDQKSLFTSVNSSSSPNDSLLPYLENSKTPFPSSQDGVILPYTQWQQLQQTQSNLHNTCVSIQRDVSSVCNVRPYLKRPRKEHPSLQSTNFTYRTICDNGRVETQLRHSSFNTGKSIGKSSLARSNEPQIHLNDALASAANEELITSHDSSHLFPLDCAPHEYLWDQCTSYFSEETSPPASSSICTPNVCGTSNTDTEDMEEYNQRSTFLDLPEPQLFLDCSTVGEELVSSFPGLDVVTDYYQEDVTCPGETNRPSLDGINEFLSTLIADPSSCLISSQQSNVQSLERAEESTNAAMDEMHDLEQYLCAL